jgi:hypothetical protein
VSRLPTGVFFLQIINLPPFVTAFTHIKTKIQTESQCKKIIVTREGRDTVEEVGHTYVWDRLLPLIQIWDLSLD